MANDKWAVNRPYYALYAYHLVYFSVNGLTAFLSTFYKEIHMTDSLIGVLTSVPSLVALALAPLIGAISDRVPRKRYVMTASLLLTAVACFCVPLCGSFWPLMLAVCGFTIAGTGGMPVATTISLEYCNQVHRPYGPVRMVGTIGYQLGLVLVGLLLGQSMRNLYPLMGIIALISAGITLFMPNVAGHQRKANPVPLRRLFADPHVCWLLGMILFATISSQFYMSFFTKHLSDLGIRNDTASVIALLSVLPELPFLLFADRLIKRTSVWNWLLIGMLLNGVRWIGLALCSTAAPIIAFQLLGVTVMACFEFVPAFYLARRVPPELAGSAQSVLTLTTFGVGKVIGSLLGGLICERTGIPAVFLFNGAMLLAGCLVFWRPTRRLIGEEAREAVPEAPPAEG